jgi:ribose 5-phosphate isomerase B
VTPELEKLVAFALQRVQAREARCAPAPAPASAAPAAPAAALAPKPPAGPPPDAARLAGPAPLAATRKGEVALASDHGGFEMKQDLARYLREVGFRVKDLGTHGKEAVDYPDYALAVAVAVARGEAFRGIVVDGVGVGSAIAANKVPGVRAATCFDAFSARNAREHNDAHVLCIGGRVLDAERAREMARIFLETEFGGDRHAKRVEKIEAIERRFLDAAAARGGP